MSSLSISLSADASRALAEIAPAIQPAVVLNAACALLIKICTGQEDGLSGMDAPKDMAIRDWLRQSPSAEGVTCQVDDPFSTVGIEYEERTAGREFAQQTQDRLEYVVTELCRRLDQPVSGVDIVPASERHRLLVEWNRTAAEYPAEDCVHTQFERQAARTPGAVALAMKDRHVSYRDLDESSNRLARHLVELGVGSDVLVGVAMERSLDMVVAQLAIMKAGGAYVPLDPSYPQARLEQVIGDAQPLTILTQERISSRLPRTCLALSVDREAETISRHSAEPLGRRANAKDLAYVIYTSGSTGKPKGVMLEHRNVVSFFAAMDRVIGPEPGAVWLAVTSISFDISVLELFWTLARGFKVVLQGGEETPGAMETQSIAANIRQHGVTHLQCTPSLMRILISDRMSFQALRGLRKLLLGGEALPVSVAEEVLSVVPGGVYNMYGPTETTIWSTTYHVQPGRNPIPIGRPIANTQTYVLDERRMPVPIGGIGELYIAGAGVARGYLNRPELTAERFVPVPFPESPGGRMYRTGDTARFLPDGNIEYLGRADSQVKLRGFRIELGEIETVLEHRPEVKQAVVMVREDRPGDQRLVAYVVPEGGHRLSSPDLGAYLQENLPVYMQPSAFVIMQSLPLTANGKTDRKALPAPETSTPPAAPVSGSEATELEQKLVEIWKDALDTDNIGVGDNYFDMGAHSLIVADVYMKIKDLLGAEFPLVTMFQYPTIRNLAAHLTQKNEETAPIEAPSGRAMARQESMRRRIDRRTRTV